jgi:hypothetical protein
MNGLAVANTSAFLLRALVTEKKYFITLTPDFEKHVTGIYLTASTDGIRDDGSRIANFFKAKAFNYATSTEKLGTSLASSGKAIPQVIVTFSEVFHTSFTEIIRIFKHI